MDHTQWCACWRVLIGDWYRETADMLVQEVLSRNMRDRRAVARYAGLTGSPDEKRHKNAGERAGAFWQRSRIRRGMIQCAWRISHVPKKQCLGAVV